MLILTRRVGEAVTIDGPCTISVGSIDRDRVRLAFEAERGVTILRDELRKETKNERIRRRILSG